MTCSFKIVDESNKKDLETEKYTQPKSVLGLDMEYSYFNNILYDKNVKEIYSYLVAPRTQINF